MPRPIPDAHVDGMVAAYADGHTAKESAELFGYSARSCRKALKIRGFSARSYSEVHRKYSVDESFFDRIDTEEKAYWLGFITADGPVYSTPRGRPCGIAIDLATRDAGHLEKWKQSIQSSHPIRLRTRISGNGGRWEKARIDINSMKLAQALGVLGVVPAKSLIVKPCTRIPESLLRHYWRGIFDGDGCIHKRSDRDRERWSLDLSGTKEIVGGFRSLILSRGIETSAVPVRSGNIWRFGVCGVALPRRVGALLWENCSIYLDRKYAAYLRLKSVKDRHRRLGRAGWIAAREAYARLGNWKAAAKEVGIPWRTVYRLRRRFDAA